MTSKQVMRQALEALEANHQHHQDYDDHDGYGESDLWEQNVKSIEALRSALAELSQQGEQRCDTARVLEWMRTPNRKAAQFAFTEGQERQAAYWIEIAQSEPAAQQVAPVAWMYTLEYGAAVADTKVSVRQLNYPFGVCGADYLAKNDDGVSYVRQTPLYKAQSVPDSLLAKLPGGKKTDQWDSARMADYDQGWNDYRKAVKAVLAGATPAVQSDDKDLLTIAAMDAYQMGKRDALAQQGGQQPVAWLPSVEWTPCVKLPVTVHVRQQRHGETHVSTREGITPVKPDDLIMRGVSGEEYPIGREIFEKTYRIGEAAPAAQPDARKVIEQMVGALELANNGLTWYKESHPESVDGSDDEAKTEIDDAIHAGQKWLKENK